MVFPEINPFRLVLADEILYFGDNPLGAETGVFPFPDDAGGTKITRVHTPPTGVHGEDRLNIHPRAGEIVRQRGKDVPRLKGQGVQVFQAGVPDNPVRCCPIQDVLYRLFTFTQDDMVDKLRDGLGGYRRMRSAHDDFPLPNSFLTELFDGVEHSQRVPVTDGIGIDSYVVDPVFLKVSFLDEA